MACDDRYAYMYEEGYTSDEDDVSDSLVTDIVEEAFRLEHEGNKNGRSESEERSFTEDNFLMQQNSAENLSRSFPRIQITEITDESELNENVVLTSLSESNCEHESTRSASECTLTERMVRFLPATPQNEPHEKRKYPTTPKPVYKTSGPSLTPLKADDSYPVQDDEQTTPLPYPADQTPSGSSDKFSDPVQETQKLMGALEDQLANLSLVMAKMETRQQSRDLNGCSPIRSASEGHFKGAGTEDSEVALQEGKELLKSLNLKWKTHKEHLADLLVEAGRREDEHLQLDRRVLEQADFVLKLQQERCALQVYLEEKEYEWMAVRRGYQADVNYIKSLIKDIKRSKEKNSNWHIVESLLRQHYNRQEAIAMDINKQNKISELHLLLCRQQLQLAEVNEENWQLEQQISELTGTPKDGSSSRRSPYLSDVLYCSHGLYTPTGPTSPQFASVKVFSIGGNHSDLPLEREKLVESSRLFHVGETETPEDLAKYDQKLMKDLTAMGPGSATFSLYNDATDCLRQF